MKETIDNEPINPEFTYIEAGVRIRIPSERWKKAGVKTGDFLGSTSLAGALNSREKVIQALQAPEGTRLLITRDNERIEITL